MTDDMRVLLEALVAGNKAEIKRLELLTEDFKQLLKYDPISSENLIPDPSEYLTPDPLTISALSPLDEECTVTDDMIRDHFEEV